MHIKFGLKYTRCWLFTAVCCWAWEWNTESVVVNIFCSKEVQASEWVSKARKSRIWQRNCLSIGIDQFDFHNLQVWNINDLCLQGHWNIMYYLLGVECNLKLHQLRMFHFSKIRCRYVWGRGGWCSRLDSWRYEDKCVWMTTNSPFSLESLEVHVCVFFEKFKNYFRGLSLIYEEFSSLEKVHPGLEIKRKK